MVVKLGLLLWWRHTDW